MKSRRLLLVVAGCLLGGLSVLAATAIINPYAEVDWGGYGKHKANLHTHTLRHRIREDGSVVLVNGAIQAPDGTLIRGPQEGHGGRNPHPDFGDGKGRSGGSDGSLTPTEKIEAYRELGYTILALTDHNMVTWPWEAYGKDPAALGMLAVQGCEPSRHHHMGSYFNDYDGEHKDIEVSIREVAKRSGLSTIFHPGRYSQPVDWYVTLFEKHEQFVGLEVYNQRDRYPQDRALWDQVLTRLMPQRPVWGMANDDAHGRGNVGLSWQVYLLPELSEAALRHAMRHGLSFFSHAPGGHPKDGGEAAPVINAITVDGEAGTIAVDASGYDKLEWVSAGRVIASGPVLDAKELQGYVRAELTGGTGRTYTQPFFVGDPEKGTPVGE